MHGAKKKHKICHHILISQIFCAAICNVMRQKRHLKPQASHEESDTFTVTHKTPRWNTSEDTFILGLQRMGDQKGEISWNIWDSHSGSDGDPTLLGHEAVSNSIQLPTFRESLLSPFWASTKLLFLKPHNFCVVLKIFVLFSKFLCCYIYCLFCVVLCIVCV